MTKNQFIAKAERAFTKANPGAAGLLIMWRRAPRLVTYPTGVQGWSGTFHAYAENCRPRTMLAEGDDTYVMVR